MTRRTVVISKEYGQKDWTSYSLSGDHTITVMPREHFEGACAAADAKLREAILKIKNDTKTLFQETRHEL